MKLNRHLAKLLALALVLATVFSVVIVPQASALYSAPDIYLYSGAGTYDVGDEITLHYRYSPCYVNYEYTYCEVYDAYGNSIGSTYRSWGYQTSIAYKSWYVTIDTDDLDMGAGTYTIKAYVYRLGTTYSTVYSYITLVGSEPSIELNYDEYEYEVPYTKTSVSKSLKLKATVTGSSEKVTWTSSNKKVATVSSSGNVKMKGIGKATITAKSGSLKAYCYITVTRQSGSDYYERYLEPYVETIEDLADEYYDTKAELKLMVKKVYVAAKNLDKYIKKAPTLKADKTLTKYMKTFMRNTKTAYAARSKASLAYLRKTQSVFENNINYIRNRLETLTDD